MRRLALSAGLLFALVGGGAWWLARHVEALLTTPYRGYVEPERLLAIRPGLSGSQALAELARAGVVPETFWLRLYLVYRLGDPPLLAGEYRFEAPLAPIAVVDKLRRGEVATYPVTVVEGLTLAETATALARAGVADEAALHAVFGRGEAVTDLDPLARDLEGYLFPDTYRFRRGVAAEEVAAAMVANFRRRFASEVQPLLAAIGSPSVREVVILASLVEKEAQLASERPLIAAVYRNRLRLGMALGADPTIIYGLKLAGRWQGNLRRVHLEEDGPYNSYRRSGLPPTPIASPGLGALQAAAAPADAEYLYFVSRNDGSHVFTRTLAEHNREVERWQRRYFRERRAARSAAERPAAER